MLFFERPCSFISSYLARRASLVEVHDRPKQLQCLHLSRDSQFHPQRLSQDQDSHVQQPAAQYPPHYPVPPMCPLHPHQEPQALLLYQAHH